MLDRICKSRRKLRGGRYRKRTKSPDYQPLEPRQMLASVTLIGDQLTVIGDAVDHDLIEVKEVGTEIQASIRNVGGIHTKAFGSFPLANVNSV